jgi:hypothetical protein
MVESQEKDIIIVNKLKNNIMQTTTVSLFIAPLLTTSVRKKRIVFIMPCLIS